MALTNCPECGIKVSTDAVLCPKCGYPFKETSKGMSGCALFFIIIAAIIIAAVILELGL